MSIPRHFFPGASLVASVLLTTAEWGSLTLEEAAEHFGDEGRFVAMELTISDAPLLIGREPHGRTMQNLRPADKLVLTRAGRTLVDALEEVVDVAGFVQDSEFYPKSKRARGEA